MRSLEISVLVVTLLLMLWVVSIVPDDVDTLVTGEVVKKTKEQKAAEKAAKKAAKKAAVAAKKAAREAKKAKKKAAKKAAVAAKKAAREAKKAKKKAAPKPTPKPSPKPTITTPKISVKDTGRSIEEVRKARSYVQYTRENKEEVTKPTFRKGSLTYSNFYKGIIEGYNNEEGNK
ncbi:MAG: hypothetical protein ACE5FT_01120 [Candidatus Nanoarchaeia archaeon]